MVSLPSNKHYDADVRIYFRIISVISLIIVKSNIISFIITYTLNRFILIIQQYKWQCFKKKKMFSDKNFSNYHEEENIKKCKASS